MKPVLENFEPDIVIVHGDTTTAFSASLAGFYEKISVAVSPAFKAIVFELSVTL